MSAIEHAATITTKMRFCCSLVDDDEEGGFAGGAGAIVVAEKEINTLSTSEISDIT